MTTAHPNTLSLAVAIVISSSIISTQALADRRLQTKSFDILDNESVEFTQSEVIVQPTLGHDQQPIPKSFTTTYPDQTEARAGYEAPSEGFTDVLPGIEGGVSSVDLFVTDDNDVAQKYTKVLKVGDQGIFKFIHDLAEKKLVIEIRKGMTDQNSIAAVRAQSGDIQPLEPFTKVANPEHLVSVLKGANERAGSLGEMENYVALATIEVDQVEVNGRTFMRLIAAGDQPPELKRLGQSLFVNDEVLLAAATSAYAQVHVLGEDLQQETLNKLLSCQKPVGYVINAEDKTLAQPVPAGFPKLEVTETPGEIIVFRGQKQNPTDIAFMEGIYDVWMEEFYNSPRPRETIQVKKDKVKSYQNIIRNRQITLLEELAAEHDNGIVNGAADTSFSYHGKVVTLAYYEYLQQTLTCASSDRADEFKFMMPHVRFISSFITPTWMHIQLVRRFRFKPILENLLTNRDFIQNIHQIITSDIAVFSDDYFDDPLSEQEGFASKVRRKFALQLIEMENELEKLRAKEAELTDQNELTGLKQYFEDELAQLRARVEEQENQIKTLRWVADQIPLLKKQVHNARTDATKARNAQLAAELGIDDLDVTQPPEEQSRLISRKIHEIHQSVATRFAATGQPVEDALDLQQQSTRTEAETPDHRPEVLRKLTAVEKTLKMVDIDSDSDVYDRRNAISEKIQTYFNEAEQRAEEEALDTLKTAEEILGIQVSEGDNKLERLDRVRKKLDDNNVIKKITEQQYHALWREDTKPADYKKRKGKHEKLLLYSHLAFHVEDADLLVKGRQSVMLRDLENDLGIDTNENAAARKRDKALIAKLADDLKVELKKDVGRQKHVQALKSRISELRLKIFHRYEDEGLSRDINNEIAHQLNIEDYKNNACVNDQIDLIEETLSKMTKEMYKVFRPTFAERIAVIENELDRQMARLGPKPRYLLDREVARARQAVREAENELEMADRKMGIFLQHARGNIALNQEMKKFQTELGLSAGDEQTNKERAEEIINFLLGYSADVRYKIIEKLNAKTNLEVSIHGDPASLQEANYVLAVDRYTYTPLHAAADEIDGIRGELPLTRKKYAQVTEFLREHDRKSMDLANAMAEEVAARENLVRKEQQMFDYENINGNPSSSDKIDRDRLNSALHHKYQAALSAKQDLADHDAFLEATEAAVGLEPDASDTNEQRINALRNKQLELGGDDGTGGKIRQLIEEPSLQMRLEAELEARKADVVRMEKVLKAAEEAVKNDRSLIQYSEKQAKLLADMNDFMQQHPIKKQALEAAVDLIGAAMENDKAMPFLSIFNFDDEFASIRVQAMAGDKLTFKQASQIVEVFKSLKTTFPKSPTASPEGQPEDTLEEIEIMVLNAMYEMQMGFQPFKDEIRGIGKTAIDFAGHEPEELNSFSEYFAAHSASANKIITLLREGSISKVELENYIKAVRGIDGYQTVDEFEHLLGYKHGVDVSRFKVVVGILSDEGVDEFIQAAFNPVTVMATHPAGMKESVVGMKEYAAAVIANYVLDDIAFENGRRTTAFLSNLQDTLTPYANVAGLSESDLIKAIHNTLMLAHVAAVEWQLNDYWVKPSAFLVQAVTWYYTSYNPLLATHTVWQAADLSLSNMAFLYLLDLTNRGDYLHRMLIPFQHWLEHYGVDPDRTAQYAHHNGIEKVSEVGGLAMPLGKAASSVILLRTGSMLFARQYNANPQMYRSIFRLVPEIVKSMGSGQGIQVPLLHRVTPQTVKTLASATAGLVLGPISTVGAYAHGLISGFTSAQTFGFALASGLTFDFFMNDNKMLTQWLGGPLGRTLDRINRWRGAGETDAEYEIRNDIASPQRFGETDAAYTDRVEANDMIHGWTRHENYLQFRERRDHTMQLFENGWEKYFRENVPKWSFSHAESIPYSYTLGAFFEVVK
ncbi:hypothetical protein [Endozoicomonas sp. 8E]|uniref:hypothetical protein n=1 Tax=Endozoicomonas sp. 8E TaxID=3035692 RepID=UPI0029390ED4|nr:hypothetical protein [Endozoicomonas sp. 8E]WOG29541.1 hypothetical protein P6910_07795 [Endozoicomonas sp. 8E]